MLDPTDLALKSFIKTESAPKAIFKVESDPTIYLVCYADFGFYINKEGRREKNDLIHYWLGPANAFAKNGNLLYIYYEDSVEILDQHGVRYGLHVLGSNYTLDKGTWRTGLILDGSIAKSFSFPSSE